MIQSISFQLLLVAAATASVLSSRIKYTKEDYCKVCADHTFCKFEGLGKACENSKDGGMTRSEIRYVVDTHNWYRRVIAKGLETRGLNGTQPPASNMMKMTWDPELAKVAQRWADQCQFQHDTCRHDPRWNVGQNIYWHYRYPVLKHVNWTAAMSSWFDEIEKFDPEIVPSYVFDPVTGHYTQLVWHDSALVGCGRRTYGPNKIYVCNYGPTGNWIEEALYSIGTACSECPKGTVCEDGLCASTAATAAAAEEEEEAAAAEEEAHSSNSTSISEDLMPPSEDAISVYTDAAENEYKSTELPIQLNLIDDLDIPDDEDIKNEIEDLKRRIRALVDKIALKNAAKL